MVSWHAPRQKSIHHRAEDTQRLAFEILKTLNLCQKNNTSENSARVQKWAGTGLMTPGRATHSACLRERNLDRS
jgi:hypothetical protein